MEGAELGLEGAESGKEGAGSGDRGGGGVWKDWGRILIFLIEHSEKRAVLCI